MNNLPEHKSFELPMATENIQCCHSDPDEIIYDEAISANFSDGQVATPVGLIPRIKTRLEVKDFFGSIKARFGAGRMNYAISPGLYAVGKPDSKSPVIVSANYKLSFDHLRSNLDGLDSWLLVLDTKGINVWCAAGKGTFGTKELLRMIDKTLLHKIVSHRVLILPQLAAPGVAAHLVKEISGFKVKFGPVRAADLPAYLAAGNEATPGMRLVRFNLVDRLVLTPIELIGIIKPLGILLFLLAVLNFLQAATVGRAYNFLIIVENTLTGFLPFLLAGLIGVLLAPVLLPIIPGRSLAWKGWFLGLTWTLFYTLILVTPPSWVYQVALLLLLPAGTAMLSLNFTGSTTYTSLSGVLKEMKIALPLIIISASMGLITLIWSYFY